MVTALAKPGRTLAKRLITIEIAAVIFCGCRDRVGGECGLGSISTDWRFDFRNREHGVLSMCFSVCRSQGGENGRSVFLHR